MGTETFEAACARHRVEIASSLRQRRAEARMTQDDLSRLIGVPQATVSRMEAGRRSVPCELLWQMADVYGITIDELIGREPAKMGGVER